MERPISAANREIGISLESNLIHSIVYADDMVLMADSQPELQEKLDGMDAALADYGMSLKSAALTIAKDGRTKSMLLLPAGYRSTSGRIEPMGIEDTQRYLIVYRILNLEDPSPLSRPLQSRHQSFVLPG